MGYYQEVVWEDEIAKYVWDTMKKLYGRMKIKKTSMQFSKKQHENIQMNDGEEIAEFFSNFVVLTNQMNSCREKTFELQKEDKVLRALPSKFDHIVVVIKDSKDLSKMKPKEL